MKKQNRALAVLGLGAAAFFLLGRREGKAADAKTPKLQVGNVVDEGVTQGADGAGYEFQVVVDSMTPGFATGVMYRGEWRQAGSSQWTVASSVAGASSFDSVEAARNNALQAIAKFDDNLNPI